MKVRDYRRVVQRLETVRAPWRLDILGQVDGHPVYRARASVDPALPTLYVNAGIHGDEPAGVEAALTLLAGDPSRWLHALQIEVIPCLSPDAFECHRRENTVGVDVNWAFLRDDVEAIRLLKRFIQGRRFCGVLDLHEDWESAGYYLYELHRCSNSLGSRLISAAETLCPVNENRMIEGEDARGGVIYPNLDREKRRGNDGVPIALFRLAHTDRLVTAESPTGLPIAQRIGSHVAVAEAMLDAYAELPPDPTRARLKSDYFLATEDLAEPSLSATDRMDLQRGIRLFNDGEFWESHEAWEQIWRRRREPSRLFFQGLIQLAAAYHQIGRGVHHGALKHLSNAGHKLSVFPDRFLGVEVSALKEAIRNSREAAERLGAERVDAFDRSLIPTMNIEG